MPRKITITLSDKADLYLANVLYGLEVSDGKGGSRPANQSEAINESLETLFDFEKATDDQVRNWIRDNYPNY